MGVLTSFMVWDGDYWRLKPNSNIVQCEMLGDNAYRIGEHGYRGAPFSAGKVEKRIVFLGDSITFGLGVRESQGFPDLIARHPSIADRAGVANLGMFGYSPYDYLNTWRRVARELRPDVVVLQLYMNDFGVKPSDVPIDVSTGRRLSAVFYMLVSKSALARRTYQGAHMVRYALAHEMRRLYWPESLNDTEPKFIDALLKGAKASGEVGGVPQLYELIKEIKGSGARLVIVYSPNEVQLFTLRFDAINAFAAEIARSSNTSFTDLTETLRNSQRKHKIFLDGLHYTSEGHAIVADVLRPEILKSLGLDPGKR